MKRMASSTVKKSLPKSAEMVFTINNDLVPKQKPAKKSPPKQHQKLPAKNDQFYKPMPDHHLERKFQTSRLACASNVVDFCQRRNKRVFDSRCRTILRPNFAPSTVKGVMYWMWRDRRVEDNWALLHSQKIALENECPLFVVFSMPRRLGELTNRHWRFMLDGLREVEEKLTKLGIPFLLVNEDPARCITTGFLKGVRNK